MTEQENSLQVVDVRVENNKITYTIRGPKEVLDSITDAELERITRKAIPEALRMFADDYVKSKL